MEDGSQGNDNLEVVWQEEVSKCSHSPIVLGGALILDSHESMEIIYLICPICFVFAWCMHVGYNTRL